MCRWSGAPITEQQRDCSSWPLGAVLQPLANAIPVSLWSREPLQCTIALLGSLVVQTLISEALGLSIGFTRGTATQRSFSKTRAATGLQQLAPRSGPPAPG